MDDIAPPIITLLPQGVLLVFGQLGIALDIHGKLLQVALTSGVVGDSAKTPNPQRVASQMRAMEFRKRERNNNRRSEIRRAARRDWMREKNKTRRQGYKATHAAIKAARNRPAG